MRWTWLAQKASRHKNQQHQASGVFVRHVENFFFRWIVAECASGDTTTGVFNFIIGASKIFHCGTHVQRRCVLGRLCALFLSFQNSGLKRCCLNLSAEIAREFLETKFQHACFINFSKSSVKERLHKT